MTKSLFYPNWKEKVVYSPEGAQPQVLAETDKFKVIVAGLEAGQKIPVHPESAGIYIFKEGTGVMWVNEEQFSIAPGATIITPDGASRGMEAKTRLAFIAVKIN